MDRFNFDEWKDKKTLGPQYVRTGGSLNLEIVCLLKTESKAPNRRCGLRGIQAIFSYSGFHV